MSGELSGNWAQPPWARFTRPCRAHRQMDYTTVQTYIRRLEDKGYLKARRDGRTKIYSARVRPGTVIGETINDLMEQLFDGEMIPLVKHLVDDRGISEEEIEQLRKILDDVEQNDVSGH